MKNILIMVLLFFSTLMHSQIVDLQKLSSGRLFRSNVLQNRQTDDVYGYFYIFFDDIIDKYHTQYSYVLLDKNLNKVTSGKFVEVKGRAVAANKISVFYRDNYITIKFYSQWQVFNIYENTSYRVLDLKENKLSEPFTLDDNANKIYGLDTKILEDPFTFSYNANPFGYSINTPLKYSTDNYFYPDYIPTAEDKTVPNKLHFLDSKLDPIWFYEYTKTEGNNKYIDITFSNSKNNTDDLVAIKQYKGKKNLKELAKGKRSNSYLFFNKDTGKLLNEFSPFGRQQANGITAKEVDNTTIIQKTKGKVTFINRIMTDKEKKFTANNDKIIGLSKVDYDITAGKVINRNFFLWEQLSQYLSIDQFGYVREKGEPNSYLYLHDALLQSNGNLLLILEQYKPISVSIIKHWGVKINDLFFVELDPKMQVVNYKRISKESSKHTNLNQIVGLDAALQYNAFDYSGYQDLGNDNYTFFYFNKQKPEGGGKKIWVIGIIKYSNGTFTEEKLNLKGKDGSELMISPAKNGYILITEEFKDKTKGIEVRLEKIN
ncbi:MAG: hypothetical protein LBE34_09980 [Flavobacteriaceae bacterium]|nr:hypothetical protein [Flavobacteriaceae bacterium]